MIVSLAECVIVRKKVISRVSMVRACIRVRARLLKGVWRGVIMRLYSCLFRTGAGCGVFGRVSCFRATVAAFRSCGGVMRSA